MPKTKLQEVIFGIMTVIIMVYGMSLFNAIARNGLSFDVFLKVSIKEMSVLAIIAFIVQALIAMPLTKKIIFKLNLKNTNKIVANLSFPFIMVCLMCLTMSLTAVIIYTGVDTNIFAKWSHAILLNFPIAFFLQVVIAGPVVRFIFGKLFAEESAERLLSLAKEC